MIARKALDKNPAEAAPIIPYFGTSNALNKILIPVTITIIIGALKLPLSNKTM